MFVGDFPLPLSSHNKDDESIKTNIWDIKFVGHIIIHTDVIYSPKNINFTEIYDINIKLYCIFNDKTSEIKYFHKYFRF